LNQALDALIEQTGHSPEVILGGGGGLAQMTKALVERVLGAELPHQLKTGRNPGGEVMEQAAGNCRNGYSAKRVVAHCRELAARVAAGHPVLCLSGGGQEDHLHDQRHREPEHATAQSNQEPRPLSQR
jgi:hypothetical protein